ncbi:MAG: 2-succinylbenzoate--CoA ligase [Myxococcota bacterium]|nr:2-succinylbenzoate--CoA ligase [Myxococcota bacterium]
MNLHAVIVELAAAWPGAPAVITGGQTVSYRELLALADEEAQAIHARLGSRRHPGAPRIAFPAGMNLRTVARFLACWKLEAAAAPWNPKQGEDGVAQAIEAAAPTLTLDRPAPPAREVIPHAEGCAAIIQTSGSSGAPKAVMLTHRNFLASARASASILPLGPGCRWLMLLSPARIGGLSIITRCLTSGAAIVIPEKYKPGHPGLLMEQHRITHLSAAPVMLDAWFASGRPPRGPGTWRAILSGGGATPAGLMLKCQQAGLPVLPTWGMTETCSQAATRPLSNSQYDGPAIGPLLSGLEARVTDQGIFHLRGDQVTPGYFNVPPGAQPFTDDGWLVTSDCGRIHDNGWVEVLGRADDMIITGGEKVHPLEVERLLAFAPGVRNCMVSGVPHPAWGQVVACALEKTPGFRAEDFVRFVRGRLESRLKPRLIAIMDRLPVTSAGKPDRRELRNIPLQEFSSLDELG